MKIAELLHFCLTAKRSGVILFKQDGGKGTIYIRDGEVVAAQHNETEGEEAFFKLLLMEGSEPEFKEQTITEPESISKSTHYLLMEAARLSDEASDTDPKEACPSQGTSERFCLNFITMENTKFALQGTTVFIGRNSECDITVPDVSVSGKHCQILWNGKDHILSDTGSYNGTYLNKNMIEKSHPLAPNDHIQVGLCHFRYEAVQENDKLEDPQTVVPFTFGSQTQKIELPLKSETGKPTFAPQAEFKDYKPVNEDKKKIHIWPFGNKS